MKPIFIIAIVSVAMIGILSPMTVFGVGSMTETSRPINIDKTMYFPGEIIEISGNIEKKPKYQNASFKNLSGGIAAIHSAWKI